MSQAEIITCSPNWVISSYSEVVQGFLNHWVDHVVLIRAMCISLDITDLKRSYRKAAETAV